MVEYEGIVYYYWLVIKDNKLEQEEKLFKLVKEIGVDLVVLVCYMQVFFDNLFKCLFGKVINIYYFFLLSFKGVKFYYQVYVCGVKMIGVIGYYVMLDLDEGLIIEQDVEWVSYVFFVDDFVVWGCDIEFCVLVWVVKYYLENWVMIVGNKMIVFML